MRIGDLAARTGVAPRMLRYYEQQGLLRAERRSNGYRDYPESSVERVAEIRGLVSSGLPTRLVRYVLGTIDDPGLAATCSRQFAASLASELAAIENRIACLSRSRDTVRSFLDDVQRQQPDDDAATPRRPSSSRR